MRERRSYHGRSSNPRLDGRLTRRQFLALTAAAAGASAISSCGGGGGGGGDSGYGAGSVAGWLYRSPSGGLAFGYTASPPTGYVPVSGATVAVPKQVSGKTGSDGRFVLNSVQTGLYVLTATSGAQTTQTNLTVLNDTTITVGDPPVTRQQAVDLAKTEAAKTIDLTNVYILAMQQPLPAGVALVPALDLARGLTAPIPYVPSTPKWLVVVDQEPIARWGHDITYLLVDAVSGAVTSQQATSWVAINGCGYYRYATADASSPDLVQGAPRRSRAAYSPQQAAPARSRGASRAMEPGCTSSATYSLVIVGDGSPTFTADVPHVKSLFGATPFPACASPNVIESWKYADPVQAAVSAWDAICAEATACDQVVLFVSSHGTADKSTPYHFILDRTAPDPSAGADGSSLSSVAVSPSVFDFTKCKACRITVIADTCHSGYWIDMLQEQLSGMEGRHAVVLASAGKTKSANSCDRDISVTIGGVTKPLPLGGVFTTGLMWGLQNGSLEDDLYNDMAKAYAAAIDVEVAYVDATKDWDTRRQVPMLWLRPLVEGEVCACGSSTVTIQ